MVLAQAAQHSFAQAQAGQTKGYSGPPERQRLIGGELHPQSKAHGGHSRARRSPEYRGKAAQEETAQQDLGAQAICQRRILGFWAALRVCVGRVQNAAILSRGLRAGVLLAECAAMQKLKFSTGIVRKAWVLRVGGYVDAANAPMLRERLWETLCIECPALLLDLSGVEGMDSAGVAVLAEFHAQLRLKSRVLGLVGQSPPVRRLLEVLQAIDVVCDCYSTLDEGIRRTQKLRPQATSG